MADDRRRSHGGAKISSPEKKRPPSPALKEKDVVSEEQGNAIAYKIGDKVAVPIESVMYGRRHPATVVKVLAHQQKCVVPYNYKDGVGDIMPKPLSEFSESEELDEDEDDDEEEEYPPAASCFFKPGDIMPRPLSEFSESEDEDDEEEEEKYPPAASCFFKPGDRVELLRLHPDYGEAWYAATVKAVRDPDTYTFLVEKGEEDEDEDEDEECQEESLENFRPRMEREGEQLDLRHGAEVEVRCGGVWAIGVVVQPVGGSQFEVTIGESKQIKRTKKIDELRPRYNWDWDRREWSVVTASKSPSEKRPRSPVDKASDDCKNCYDSESSASKKARIECQQRDVMLEGSEHALISNTDDVSGKTSCKLRRKVTTRRTRIKKRHEGQCTPHSSLDAITMQFSAKDTDGSELDGELTTTISNSCQANRNEDATQIPFIKSLPAWSTVEEMEVFKKMPQRPHFGLLEKELLVLREGLALGLMGLFANVVESISKSSVEDSYESFEEKNCVLSLLKHNRFSVDTLQTCLNKLIEMKSEYAKHIEEIDGVQAQKRLKEQSCSRLDSLRGKKMKAIAKLLQEVRQVEEEQKCVWAELSELDDVENMVDKACDDIEERFGDTLVDYLG